MLSRNSPMCVIDLSALPIFNQDDAVSEICFRL